MKIFAISQVNNRLLQDKAAENRIAAESATAYARGGGSFA